MSEHPHFTPEMIALLEKMAQNPKGGRVVLDLPSESGTALRVTVEMDVVQHTSHEQKRLMGERTPQHPFYIGNIAPSEFVDHARSHYDG